MKKQKSLFWVIAIFLVCMAIGLLIHLQHQITDKTNRLSQKNLRGYLPVSYIETSEKFGFYYVWFYYEHSIYPTEGFSIEVTKDQLQNLSVLRQIVMETNIPLKLTDTIKTIFESEIIERIIIEATSGACAARAFIKKDAGLSETICLEPIPMITLFVILAYRRHPMPDFYAKMSLFEDINKEKPVYIGT